jgi:hypothetical protein
MEKAGWGYERFMIRTRGPSMSTVHFPQRQQFRRSPARWFRILAAASALAVVVSTQAAGVYFQNSQGLVSPSNTITFSEYSPPPNTIITTQYQAYGVTFAPYVRYASIYDQNSGTPNIDPTACVANFQQYWIVVPTFSLIFDRPVAAAAFAVLTQPGTFEVTALWAGVELPGGPHTFTGGYGPDRTTNFVGFSGATFDELRIGNIATSDGALVLDNLQFTPAVVNSWTNPASGRWDAPANWSLATAPASNQTVIIDNSGYKAVNIDGATFANFPASVTVSNLLVAAPTNALNTLLLNYAGLNTPLRVLNDCIIGTNGTIDNFSSSFEVDGTNGGALTIDGGSFEQIGGQTVVNAPVNIRSGFLRATNANLTLGQTTLGTNQAQEWGYVQQDGGSIAASFVNIVRGSYSLAAGNLYALQGMQLSSDTAAFYQSGGTNYGNITLFENSTYQLLGGMAQGNVLSVSDSINHYTFQQDYGLLQMQFINVTGGSNYTGFPCFELNNGMVRCGTLNIGGNGTFGQSGGQVVLTNNMDMHGEFFITSRGNITEHSDYLLNNGQLQASSISLGKFATFRQFGGSVTLPNGLSLTLFSALYRLGGGTLTTTYTGISGDFQQTGGHHEVDGVLSLVGSYELQGGDLIVQGLYTRGSLSLAGSGVFTNTGIVNLGGTITTSASNAVLGQIQLATNTTFGFSGFPAHVYCSSSSGISWTSGALLTITNWSSARDGHLYFGTDASGLSASQLRQISFSNPGGFPPGTYPAQLLATGELVPAPRPTLQSTRTGSALVLTWPSGYQLLSATNISGPYTPVSGASSPWTNHYTKPQEFFKIQGL